MNDHGQSDSKVVPKKSSNKAGKLVAEMMEGSALAEGNEGQQNARRTQSRESANSKLELIREKAKADREMRFTTLFHHIYDIERLRTAYLGIKGNAAAGVDGVTWQSYGERLEANLADLSERLKRMAYRAKPIRRVYIPKPDGTQRPLGIPVLEDKIVQRATVEVLNAIYEVDFQGFSYGFRPGRSQHRALDALYVGITKKKVNWVLDADIRDFFGTIRFEELVNFIEIRIADTRVVRLIQKWLKAGILEDGSLEYVESGAPQGGSASPLLANVYLHYIYDVWIKQWRKTEAKGEVIVVRYADDTIVGFERKDDAEQFVTELEKRLIQFGLELHPQKTRLIAFGRYAAKRRTERGEGKPETFTFLGFTHICSENRKGMFEVKRQTNTKKMRNKLRGIKTELRRRINEPVREIGDWLKKVITGHYAYYAVPGNYRALNSFRYHVTIYWFRTLKRRSQKCSVTWARMHKIAQRWLPIPRITHPYPDKRFFCRYT